MSLHAACALLVLSVPLAAQRGAPGVPGSSALAIPATRLVGVYDDSTGAPLAGVEVGFVGMDFMVRTGTGGLAVVPRFGHSVAILQARLISFAPVMRAVETNDTTPVTIVLRRSAQSLPTVNVSARPENFQTRRYGEAQERWRKSGAPADAFITSEDIARRAAIKLTDVLPRGNLGLGCPPLKSLVYVNGIESPQDPSRRRFGMKDNPIDENDVSSVDFMEVYRHEAEYPPEFNRTRFWTPATAALSGRGTSLPATPSAAKCLILIWLK